MQCSADQSRTIGIFFSSFSIGRQELHLKFSQSAEGMGFT
jgi:hypothetical protein